jgi:hypothetical protein
MIQVPEHMVSATFAFFRACGGGQRECVAYWLGPIAQPDIVNEVIHPEHMSARGGYQLSDAWLTRFWFDLARRGKSVRVQVHTHPHAAFHSATDDAWALVDTPGFLSLVIPNFGQGPIGLDAAFLTERLEYEWRNVAVAAQLRIVSGANEQ